MIEPEMEPVRADRPRAVPRGIDTALNVTLFVGAGAICVVGLGFLTRPVWELFKLGWQAWGN